MKIGLKLFPISLMFIWSFFLAAELFHVFVVPLIWGKPINLLIQAAFFLSDFIRDNLFPLIFLSFVILILWLVFALIQVALKPKGT